MPGPLNARFLPHKAPGASLPPTPQKAPDASSPSPELAPEKNENRSKKRKRTDAQDATRPDDADVPKKHKSVLQKFERSTKVAERLKSRTQPAEDAAPSEEPELHDLVPLPQPEPILDAPYKPKFSSLPSWLTEPITAPTSTTKPWDQLNIDPKLVRNLKSKGYNEAFAVQSAVLPLLLPGAPPSVADVCVSAATGSGKTLAYLLPMVESMRHQVVTKLRGVIVVPTRELVGQVREAAELCSVGSGVKIGTAMGNNAFSVEQDLLIRRGKRYDPVAAGRLHAKATDQLLHGWSGVDDYAESVLDMLPGHVPRYESKVDILICTPGRLVEHLQHTRGFTLDDVNWLVIDEADRLLDQSFQGWAETVMKGLEKEKAYENMDAREKILSSMWYAPQKRLIRKVILSATMTRDLNKLSALKLRRPTLVVAEGMEGRDGEKTQGEVYDLPSTLEECTIPVGDGSQKPLFLLQLLQKQILWDFQPTDGLNGAPLDTRQQPNDSDTSSSESDSSSEASDDSSSVSSESEDSDSSDSGSTASEAASSDSETSESSGSESSPGTINGESAGTTTKEAEDGLLEPVSNVLIFTHNNENANRLSRLLSLLHPSYAGIIGTLTKSSTNAASRKILRAFRANKLRILIASDRASRGLDLPNLAHIVNYDIPTSITSYVHRVGRTARAGAYGMSWTFLTKSEAGWFWNVVARGEGIRRGGRKVQRMRLEDAVNPERTEKYEHALETLKEEVRGGEEK